MALFFTALVGFTFLGGTLVLLLGAVLGDVGVVLGAALAMGTLLALLVCVLDRLSDIRKMLDELRQELALLKELPNDQMEDRRTELYLTYSADKLQKIADDASCQPDARDLARRVLREKYGE